jgi:hypothetical protein
MERSAAVHVAAGLAVASRWLGMWLRASALARMSPPVWVSLLGLGYVAWTIARLP